MLAPVSNSTHPDKENIVNTSLLARRLARSGIASLALVGALVTTLFVSVAPAQAAEQVVTNCSDDAQFSSLLQGGGTITFDCGAALIYLSSEIGISTNTTIDGGGQVTLSGDNELQLFAINQGASLTLRNIILTDGFSPEDGGAIYNAGSLALENSTIRASHALASGGAIVSYGPLRITNSLLEGNWADNGGALYPRWANAQTVIVGSVLRNNQATSTTEGWGGAILAWDGAPVTIEGSDISNNTARQGGAVYHFGNSVLTLRNSNIFGNQAQVSGGSPFDGLGGGLYNYSGAALLTNVNLNQNTANYIGGGLYNDANGTATLTNVTLWANEAFYGGGLYNPGTATLTNVTLSGNSATSSGGGLYNLGSGTATLTNVTFTGNSATSNGGGIYRSSGTVTVKNTIVANSRSGANCAGVVIDSGFNLATDTSCGVNYVRDILLGALADNGGPTLTHMPQPGSWAIDHGADCPELDQRGIGRPQGPACDIGAVEFETPVQQ